MAIDFPNSPTQGDTFTSGDRSWIYNGYAWDIASTGTVDHGVLEGLGDDDHTQYLLADGSRTLSGNLTVTGTVDGRDISADWSIINLAVTSYDVDDIVEISQASYDALGSYLARRLYLITS